MAYHKQAVPYYDEMTRRTETKESDTAVFYGQNSLFSPSLLLLFSPVPGGPGTIRLLPRGNERRKIGGWSIHLTIVEGGQDLQSTWRLGPTFYGFIQAGRSIVERYNNTYTTLLLLRG